MSVTYNPFTSNFDFTGMTATETAAYLLLNQSTPQTTVGTFIFPEIVTTRSGTITRDGTTGLISVVAKTGGRTLTVTRDGNNYISSITDGTRTWAFTRNGSNQITSWAVA